VVWLMFDYYVCIRKQFARSLHGVPVMAASIRLRVGLGGIDMLRLSVDCSCSGRRVLPYLMTFGSPRARLAAAKPDVS
jgi:hypothetical protein